MEKTSDEAARLAEWAKQASNALGTPEAIQAHCARPENSQQAASPEQISEWIRNGGVMPMVLPL